MTLVSIPRGLYYPFQGITGSLGDSYVVDATGERIAMMGRVYINGRPTASKTISAAGGGSISFYINSMAWGANSSTVDIGIQDVSASNPPQPDGVFDVKRTYTSNTNALTANTWTTISMTGGSNSKTIAHGDLIAVVIDMTLRNSTDSISVSALNAVYTSLTGASNNQGAMPGVAAFTGGTWGTTNQLPNCIITFDDGTIATLDGGGFFKATDATNWTNGSVPDERGNIFQVPFNCKVDAFLFGPPFLADTATSDFNITLYSDPTGTPTSLQSFTLTAEQLVVSAFSSPGIVLTFPTEVSLARNTDYCLAVKATSTGDVYAYTYVVGDTSYRALLPGGTTLKKATRDNSTGPFTAESPAITTYNMFVRISQVDDGAATGSILFAQACL